MDTPERISDFMDRHHVMSLATIGPDGPHAASVFYGRIGFRLFWVSSPQARHSLHIEVDARIAATIASETTHYADIRGLQIHGSGMRVSDPARRGAIRDLLERRFPFLAGQADLPPALNKAWRTVEIYELSPAEIVFTDNTRGFGHKDTLRFEAGAIAR